MSIRPTVGSIADALIAGDADVVDVYRDAVAFASKNSGVEEGRLAEMLQTDLGDLLRTIDRKLASRFARGDPAPYTWDGGDLRSGLLVHARLTDAAGELRAQSDRDKLMELVPLLSDRQFEYACAHLLEVYGASAEFCKVTRRGGDGGLDFYAIVMPSVSPRGRDRLTAQGMRIAGQAKKWANSVPIDPVEAFGSRLEAWRLDAGEALDGTPEWFRAHVEFPIIGLFVTTSRFEEGARKAAIRHVVIPLDLKQVAQDLAWSPARPNWVSAGADGLDAQLFLSYFPKV